MEDIEEEQKISKKIKAENSHSVDSDDNDLDHDSLRRFKRAVRSLAKPSYLLGLGPNSKSVQCEYRERLTTILRDLLRQQNWREASGVLSVLMQGTMGDRSPELNRLKYIALIRIQSRLTTDGLSSAKIGKIYDTWIGKIGKEHKEERLSVCIEQILHFLKHGNDDDAYQAAVSLMQDRELGKLPRSHLFVGLTFYALWSRNYLNHLQSEDADPSILGMSESRSDHPIGYSGGYESVCSLDPEASAGNVSESSVMNEKRISHALISVQEMETDTKVDTESKLDNPVHLTQTATLYASSDENESLQNDAAHTFNPSLVSLLDTMESWLLPVKLPKDPAHYVKMLNDSHYKEAVKYMRLALDSSHPVSLAALRPLVQLLLMGGQIDEAKKEVDKVCDEVRDLKAFRIRAVLLETFHPDSDMLAKCYEDVLNIDGRCTRTLMKLINLHHRGVYDTECLIEMIALHLEVSYPKPEIWRQFATCFFELCQTDEDRMSVCADGTEGEETKCYSVRYSRTPKVFTDRTSGKAWKLRRKWWLTRHFSLKTLDSEIESGELELMACKGACASHMYGQDFGYVAKVYGLLDKGSHSDLFMFLQNHRLNSIRVFDPD
ncbi:PREDICTED: uncharacterized protein LOC104798752 isoform X2 [Tarenaya hassleriana]|uniref:uncharacterized protein LOC104798752 isoform X2 n=1 Tax=Tarenaya hassleriana TaxID=28532 RepID=UPI00053C7333|nr:PREDICTED: uncharacterized protein LOC104798752 isoform X2 [Tarenaya hassleriana]